MMTRNRRKPDLMAVITVAVLFAVAVTILTPYI